MLRWNVQRSDGFSLIELMITVAIFAIVSLGLFSGIIAGYQLDRINREKSAATNALRMVAETLSFEHDTVVSLSDFYTEYRTNNKGYANFTAAQITTLQEMGLRNLTAYTNGKPIKIECWANETNATAAGLYPSPDFNLDGDSLDNLSGPPLDATCRLLLVRLTLEWNSINGNRARQESVVFLLGVRP